VEPLRPHVVVAADAGAVARAGARLWVDEARHALAERGVLHVALAGGKTPQALYRAVAEEPDLDYAWHRTHLWWGDERAVPADDSRSNAAAATRLLDSVPVPAAQVHAMEGGAEDLVAAAARYEAQLRAALAPGADGLPEIDLVLLGMGADGHTASLFPGSAALEVHDRLACAVTDAPAPFPRRLTLTLPMLAAARRVVVVATGIEKSSAVAAALEPTDPAAAAPPVARVRPGAGRLVWLLDEAAAARLTHTPRAHAAGSGA
jgi:6-phosphogluconolactonase